MDIDLTYVPEQDRIRLLARHARQPSEWWMTRPVVLRLLDGWVKQLEAVPMPSPPPVPAAPWMPPPVTGLARQHTVLMEMEPPRSRSTLPAERQVNESAPGGLVHSITLAVKPIQCTLLLRTADHQLPLRLSRKDAHALLEGLAQAVLLSGWLKGHVLPAWLGQGASTEPSTDA